MFNRLYGKLKNISSEYSEVINTILYSSIIGFSLGLAYLGVRRQVDYYEQSLIIQTRLLEKMQEHNNILVSNLLNTK
jgi:hypothetical protein